MFPRLAIYHAFDHAVRITDGWRQDVGTGRLDESFRFRRTRQTFRDVQNLFVYLRTGSDVADLSFYQDGWVDLFESFDSFFGLAQIFFERQRREVEND